MDDASLAQALPALLVDLWGIDGGDVEPLGGGMNSATALATTKSGDRLVAKWSGDVASLRSGCSTAAVLGAAGLRSGAPVPLLTGALTATVGDGALALLRHVPGRELDGGSPHEQRLMATTLAHAHQAGAPGAGRGAFMQEWLSPADDALDVAEWLAPALHDVRAEYAGLPTLTWTQLHTDPAPEAFLHDDATETTGLIDWAGSCRGPALYDVASAVMYLGGPDQATTFLDTYVAAGPLDDSELRWLDTFRRLRWAIQASYFAGRIVAGDRTGFVDDPEHNRDALARARRGLEETASGRHVR